MGKNGRVIQNGTVMQKRHSTTKNGTEVQKNRTKTHCSAFCSAVEKNGTVVLKTEQWYKTHCSGFVLLWKKRNRSAKNGTVVQKRNRNAKNGKKHTVPFFVPLWKNGTVVQKTEQWYKNTLFRFLFCCGKNGTVVQKNGTVVQEHTVPFFVPLWKNGTVVQKMDK